MKNLVLFIATLLCLSACSTDLTEISKRIDEIESQGKNLEKENDDLQKESERLKQEGEELQRRTNELESEAQQRQAENEKIRRRLAEIEDSLNTPPDPYLLTMEFIAADNPLQLIEDTRCTIIGDSMVECRILNTTSDKVLIPRFTFQGSVVTINGVEAESGVTPFDFSGPVVLSVITSQKVKDYLVYVSSYTGLPTVWLETIGHVDIAYTDRTYGGVIKVIDNVSTRAASTIQASVKISCLGSVEWYQPEVANKKQLAKNTYGLNFSNGISLFDEPKGTKWKVYPNNGDLTMLHNQMAFYMGKMSHLNYTPRAHFVDMFFNSRFFGTYLLEELPEISEDKVNVGSNGFILSVGADESGTAFSTDHLEKSVTILEPSNPSSEELTYVSSFVTAAESALFSSDFANETSGWQKYMDMDSFVDWYLINEISKNYAGAFRFNCLMNLKRGGKLEMGPLMDFELAFGDGGINDIYGLVIKNTNWFTRLFQDPAFVARVKERFNFFYDHQQDILAEINANAAYLKTAVRENDNKWDVFSQYKYANPDAWVLYGAVVDNMKSWLRMRMDWLKGEYDAMG